MLVPLLLIGFAGSGVANPIYVTTTHQGVTDPHNCSLQEAIYAADFDANIAIDSTNFYTTGCLPGNGADIIYLPDGATFQMDHIQDDQFNPFGPTATPIIFTTITIEANGATIMPAQNAPNMRAFAFGPASISTPNGTITSTGNVTLTIRNAYFKGFHVKGGDGNYGGGGGLGAGGAIYAEAGFGSAILSLNIENSTFDGNGAVGGNGTHYLNLGPGGGGGGLGGNGGGAEGDQTGLVEGGTGGGGGGGGSRGSGGANGGNAACCNHAWASPGGGGGGGTILAGSPALSLLPNVTDSAGGFACGGTGGGYRDDGHDASCRGGGGGGGGQCDQITGIRYGGDGGNGNYGGGGGGGCFHNSVVTQAIFGRQGGSGGFGGGGGAGGQGDNGGNGGFGGGGGAGGDTPGKGGPYGGNGSHGGGGAGGGLGGAIFSHFANVTIKNSTFTGNYVSHGMPGGAGQGGDSGGAIFAVDGTLTVLNSTISNNQATGAGGGIVVYQNVSDLVTSLTLRNTIIANNGNAECIAKNGVTAFGSGNLILQNSGCPGLVVSLDPQLGLLSLNPPGNTPTLAIDSESPAYNAADGNTALSQDQRGVLRPQASGFDIGAYEFIKPSADLAISKTTVGEPYAGKPFSWIIDVENQGRTDAQNVTVTDTIPAGVTFSSITGSGGFHCTSSTTGNTTTVTCTKVVIQRKITTPVPMSSGEIDSLTLTVSIPASFPAYTQLTNTATIKSSTPDPNPGNNSASVTAIVKPAAAFRSSRAARYRVRRKLH